jgi:glyoxylase-like metal-dependent hydrolase (beta-lactamase superfamily II)
MSWTTAAKMRLPALAQLPRAAVPDHAQPGFHHLSIGGIEVIALSDGSVPIPAGRLLANGGPGEAETRLRAQFQDPEAVHTSVNAYLVKDGARHILIDAGTGQLFGPELDKLGASLTAAGTPPAQVTDIFITHIHTDHTGGLSDGARLVYPNATVHVEQREADYWLSAAKRDRAPAARQRLFREAAQKMQPYIDAGRVKTFSGATQLSAHVRSQPAPGHTPGHSFYVLESAGDKLVFWGDLVHVAEVQLANPAVTIEFDVDQPAAARQRKLAFADAAAGRYWIAADHIAFPGIGHLRADGKG